MQQFFQQFNFGPPQDVIVDPNTPEIRHNLMIMEMYNNWPHIRWLMCRHREGWLKQMDPLENEWFQIVTQNNIDVEADKTGEEFLRVNLKKIGE